MDVVGLCRELIRIPSYVQRDGDRLLRSERAVGEFLSFVLRERGLSPLSQEVEDGRRNVIVGAENPRVLFVSHLDTVAPSSSWSFDPFSGEVRDERVHGVGAVDMKGSIAALVTALSEEGPGNWAALFDVGEEYDFRGIKRFLSEHTLSPDMVVVTEPTDLTIRHAHRGLIELSLRVRGRTAHASEPSRGRNAITGLVGAIDDIGLDRFAHPDLGPSTGNLAYLHGGLDTGAGLGREGNQVPDLADAVIDVRPADPSLDAAKLQELLHGAIEARELILENVTVRHDRGPLLTGRDEAGPVAEAVSSVLGSAEFKPMSGYGEGQMIKEAWGCPVIYLGPGPSAMTHVPEEYVSIESMRSAVKIYQAILAAYR